MASKNLYLDESALVPCTDANWDILENDAPLRITSPISEKRTNLTRRFKIPLALKSKLDK